MLSKNLRLIIGLATIIASSLHILSDFLEIFSGGFSTEQLWLNYVAFLPIPFLMIGLYTLQRPLSGWMSLTGAISYGTSFIFFAGTTLYALVAKTADYSTLLDELGSIVRNIAFIGMGIAILRTRKSV